MRGAVRKQDNLTHDEDSDLWFQVVQCVDDAEAIAAVKPGVANFQELVYR